VFGVGRTADVIARVRPDVVVIQNDPWNIPAYMKEIDKLERKPVVVGAIAVDGKNCWGKALNKLDFVIFWTEFARTEALQGGLTAPSAVVPLGVDLNVFSPGDKQEARQQLGLPEDVQQGFIVTNINRNQPRKRLDLTIRYFGEWIRRHKVPDAFLYLHIAPTGDLGYHCERLAEYYGFNTKQNPRLILAEPEMFHGTPESFVVKTMRAADVGLTTSLGEGWGLTTMELMACGVPMIAPDHSALHEWAYGAACLLPCSSTEANPMSVIGSVMDENSAVAALDMMYSSPKFRESWRKAGLARVRQEEYRWPNIARAFEQAVASACHQEHV
jgi:glycosyltransferase involved in cell wall biosynthesis